jgi:hypothetical protein
MLEWMIALTAICGAASGLAILYIALHAALRVRSDRMISRKYRRIRAAGDLGRSDATLPRATVHRVSPTLGLRRLRRCNVASQRA